MPLLAFALLVAACNGGAQTASKPGQASEAQATATPSPTPLPTVRPTVEPEGVLEKFGEYVYAYKSFSASAFVSYQVIVVLHNSGSGWAQQLPGQSDYTILNPDGGVTATGSFIYAFPEFVAPGETGYLLEDSVKDGVAVDDFATVDVSGRFQAVGEVGAIFTVADIAWRTSQFGDGLTATGFVTATQDVSDAALAVFCLDADGVPLAGTYTNLLQNLTGGEKKGFETVSDTPPLKASQCVTSVGFAQDTGF